MIGEMLADGVVVGADAASGFSGLSASPASRNAAGSLVSLNCAVFGERKNFTGEEFAAGVQFFAGALSFAASADAVDELNRIGGDQTAFVVQKLEVWSQK